MIPRRAVNRPLVTICSSSMSGGASEGSLRVVSLHTPWQQETTPQLSAHTHDVMADARRRVEVITHRAFTQCGRSILTFHHNTSSTPGSPAYCRFMAAVHPNRGALPTVSLAFHCTPTENVYSICEHGLRCSSHGTMGKGVYLTFGADDVADYRCGRGGAVIVCLCAMHDPKT